MPPKAMGILSRDTVKYFKDLPDGRCIYFPKGPLGPGYELRDLAKRERLERKLKAITLLGSWVLPVVGPLLIIPQWRERWWWIAVVIVILAVVDWRIRHAAVEGLIGSSETYSAEEVSARYNEEEPWFLLVLFTTVGVLMIGVSVLLWLSGDRGWQITTAAGVGALIAAVSMWRARTKWNVEDGKYKRKPIHEARH